MSQNSKKKKDDSPICANCDGGPIGNGASLSKCARCRLVSYCSKACQKQHWGKGGHREHCVTPRERRVAAQAKVEVKSAESNNGDDVCPVCYELLFSSSAATPAIVALPCSHEVHPACLAKIRRFGEQQLCPVCRSELPPSSPEVQAAGGHKNACAAPQPTRMDPQLAKFLEILRSPSQISSGKAKKLVSQCVDLHWVASNGISLLTMAATHGHASVVELLIKKKVSLNHQNSQGDTALILASSNGHTAVLDLLLKAQDPKVDMELHDNDGMTAFTVSADKGHASIVRRLIKMKANLNYQAIAGTDASYARRATGATPLFIAAQLNHLEVVSLLLDAGADVNLAASDGASPLLISSMGGFVEVVRLLLNSGANANQLWDFQGSNPLNIAAQQGHLEVVGLLLDHGADMNKVAGISRETPLGISTLNDYVEVVDLLVNRGADVNIAGACSYSGSPLFVAAQKGSVELVSILLRGGADVNQARTIDGATPLFVATQGGHVEVMGLLLGGGANLNEATTAVHFGVAAGSTPLSIATDKGHSAAVAVLNGAIDQKDLRGN